MKSTRLLLLFSTLLCAAFADEIVTPEGRPIKTHKEVRFQIVVLPDNSSTNRTLKIDTQTGKTWLLQFSSEADTKKGVSPLVWTELIDLNQTGSELPASVTGTKLVLDPLKWDLQNAKKP